MLARFLIYSILTLIGALLLWMVFRKSKRWSGRFHVVHLLLFIMVAGCFHVGWDRKPDEELVVTGRYYQADDSVTIGSDLSNDLVLSTFGGIPFAPFLAEIVPMPGNQYQLQLRSSSNIVSVGNYRLRSALMAAGKCYRVILDEEPDAPPLYFDLRNGIRAICDKKDYSGMFRQNSFLLYDSRRHLGLKQPPSRLKVTRYMFRMAAKLGIRVPPPEKIKYRIDPLGRFLKGASMRWESSGYASLPSKWIFEANDLDVTIHEVSFPENTDAIDPAQVTEIAELPLNSIVNLFDGQDIVFINSDFNNTTRWDYRFYSGKNHSRPEIALLRPESQRINYELKSGSDICISNSVNWVQGYQDLIYSGFPRTPAYLHRQGGHLMAATGEEMKDGEMYPVGTALVQLNLKKPDIMILCILIIAMVFGHCLFFPSNLLRYPASSFQAAMFCIVSTLLSIRFILAYRAWQKYPNADDVMWDSLLAAILVYQIILLFFAGKSFPVISRRLRAKLASLQHGHVKKTKQESRHSEISIFTIGLYSVIVAALIPEISMFRLAFCAFIPVTAIIIRFLYKPSAIWSLYDKVRRHYLIAPLMIVVLTFLAPLLGGKESIFIGSVRFSPSSVIQILSLLAIALMVDHFRTKQDFGVRTSWFLSSLVVIGLILFTQVAVSHDIGFFVINHIPLLAILLLPTFRSNFKSSALLTVLYFAGFVFIWHLSTSVAWEPLKRIDFASDRTGLAFRNFDQYMRQIPVLWSGNHGFWGAGYFQSTVYAGVRQTCVNDHVASVFLLGELGVPAIMFVGTIYVSILAFTIWFFLDINRKQEIFSLPLVLPLFVFGLALSLTVPGLYMILANTGLLPLTGKNLPLLGLNSVNDGILYGFTFAIILFITKQVNKRTLPTHRSR